MKTPHQTRIATAALAASALTALAGCANFGGTTGTSGTSGTTAGTAVTPPANVPTALQVPAGQVPFVEALATGVQLYQCEAALDPAGTGSWKFIAPRATLVDTAGHPLGKHFAGPTWQSVDGSDVVGTLVAKAPAPGGDAVDWLLLKAKSTSGNGLFSATTYILRVNTKGGTTPTQACGAANDKQMVGVPYTATYYLYRAA